MLKEEGGGDKKIFLTNPHNIHRFSQICLLLGNNSHVSDVAHGLLLANISKTSIK